MAASTILNTRTAGLTGSRSDRFLTSVGFASVLDPRRINSLGVHVLHPVTAASMVSTVVQVDDQRLVVTDQDGSGHTPR